MKVWDPPVQMPPSGLNYNTFTYWLMKKYLMLAFVCVIIGAGIVYIGPNYVPSLTYAKSDYIASNVNDEICSSNNEFGLDLFRALNRKTPDENIFISPMSICTALSMAYSGANGETKMEMEKVLGIEGLSPTEHEKGFRGLYSSLSNVDDDITLNIANSAWIREEYEEDIITDYSRKLEENYISSIHSEPFDQGTVDKINSWIREKTDNKIYRILDSIESDTVLFLINAIDFSADWTNSFNEENTRQRSFLLLDGSEIDVDTMSMEEDIMYYRDETISVARFPYGREKVAMYIFLPAYHTPVSGTLESLSNDKIEDYISKMVMTDEVDIRLPKFKLEYGSKKLNEVLISMGMVKAFNKFEADFSGIADSTDLFVSAVEHTACIEVNESGTAAAGTTTVTVQTYSHNSSPRFIVNHPFFFIIRDDRTGSILFMGKIMNPLVEKAG